MNKKLRRTLLITSGVVIALAAALVISLAFGGNSAAIASVPARSTNAPITLDPLGEILPLDPVTCGIPVDNVRTCELWATTGTIEVPGGVAPVPIWGFTDVSGGTAQLPGPILIANEGETLSIVLHNDLLSETVSLYFPGFDGLMPDIDGVGAGGSVTYDIPLNAPGTYQYMAGLTPNGMRQVTMGMYGVIIVRPIGFANQAYSNINTAFEKEAVLVLSEIDPAFNASPNDFDMVAFSPKYWLMNGKAYPDTDWIGAAPGERVLLRYVNAGVDQYTVGLLGNTQTLVGANGMEVPYPITLTADLIDPGQSLDMIVTVPAEAVMNTVYPLFESSLMQHNSSMTLSPNTYAMGGMLTFINVNSIAPIPPAGPTVTVFTAAPEDTNDAEPLYINATITGQDGALVDAIEFFSDPAGLQGVNFIDESVSPAAVVDYPLTLDTTTLSSWRDVLLAADQGSQVKIYVRGRSGTTWGVPRSAIVNFDIIGPETYGVSLKPNPTNGTKSVLINGTADERYTGFDFVVSAEYTLDGSPWRPLTLPPDPGYVVALQGSITAEEMASLSDGLHPVEVRATDGHGNIGASYITPLTVDKTPPTTGVVTLTPDVIDMTNILSYTYIRLDATLSDPLVNEANSNIVKAYAFWGDSPTPFQIFPVDGKFDEVNEAAYFDIPVVNFTKVPVGTTVLTMNVVGVDAAGNQAAVGPENEVSITVIKPEGDYVGPDLLSSSVSPSPSAGARDVTLVAEFTDTNGVAAIEWYVGNDPGWGLATSMDPTVGAYGDVTVTASDTFRVNNWRPGTYTLYVRAKDTKENWSSRNPVTLVVTRNNQVLVLSDSFTAGLSEWDAVVGNITTIEPAQLPTVGGTSVQAVDMGMQAVVNGTSPSYLALNMPPGENTLSASFYFNPNGIEMVGAEHQIFMGKGWLNDLFGIEFRQDDTTWDYYIQAWALTAGGRLETGWVPFTNETHKLELVWNTATSGELLKFSMDGVLLGTLNGEVGLLDGAYTELRLGPSGLTGTTIGFEYFDTVNINRTFFLFVPVIRR